jgi:hypothetical protein
MVMLRNHGCVGMYSTACLNYSFLFIIVQYIHIYVLMRYQCLNSLAKFRALRRTQFVISCDNYFTVSIKKE